MYSADQVWGLAVRADTLNQGYFKEDQWNTSSSAHFKSKEANKTLVKRWLREGQHPDDQEIEQGREVRHYFNGFLLKELAGKINDFERQALRIAQMDEFTGKHLFEFSVVSCLPQARRRDQDKTALEREIRESTWLEGQVGDKIQGEVEIVKSYYSKEYNKFRITAKLVDSFVDFWYNNDMEQGSKVYIKAKIKSIRGDRTTQLHYVKKA